MIDGTAIERAPGGMSDLRRHRLRLEISREASRLFWAQGVAKTGGDQIAEAVGLSTRTIWRHFRSKESCAEPIVMQGIDPELRLLRSWPLELPLEVHLVVGVIKFSQTATPIEVADNDLAVKMIRLADDEPAIRTAWLMACDQVELELVRIIAKRLKLPADDIDVRIHAAAASAALRVINEDVGAKILAGTHTGQFADTAVWIAQAIRRATGGSVGDAVEH
ncbi:TetR/AcrR family transcriptional regulator [Streptomyces sp. NPDC088788]|uniref:TetR/AcrR family transcriptional regulator n=1 Tax=Streptomyces sp. NPDC088788 TaxID=3365898 RepID=UPI00381004B2